MQHHKLSCYTELFFPQDADFGLSEHFRRLGFAGISAAGSNMVLLCVAVCSVVRISYVPSSFSLNCTTVERRSLATSWATTSSSSILLWLCSEIFCLNSWLILFLHSSKALGSPLNTSLRARCKSLKADKIRKRFAMITITISDQTTLFLSIISPLFFFSLAFNFWLGFFDRSLPT